MDALGQDLGWLDPSFLLIFPFYFLFLSFCLSTCLTRLSRAKAKVPLRQKVNQATVSVEREIGAMMVNLQLLGGLVGGSGQVGADFLWDVVRVFCVLVLEFVDGRVIDQWSDGCCRSYGLPWR